MPAPHRRPPCGRDGFSLIELLVVLALVNLVAAVAVPRYGEAVVKARAAAVAADIRTITVAARSFHAEHNAWPAEAANGEIPEELAAYLPGGLSMGGPGYTLDWENWSLPDGDLLTVSLNTDDQRLGPAVAQAMRSQTATLQLENRHTFVVGRGRGNGHDGD